MKKRWSLALIAALLAASCSSDVRPQTVGSQELRFADPTSQAALDKIRGTVRRLAARAPDGSVFVLEPDMPDASRTIDALLALGGAKRLPTTDSGPAVDSLLAHRDDRTGFAVVDGNEDPGLYNTWRLAQLSSIADGRLGERIRAWLRDPRLLRTLRLMIERTSSAKIAHLRDRDVTDLQLTVDLATISGDAETRSAAVDQVTGRSTAWCGELANSLRHHHWRRAAAAARLLSGVDLKCHDVLSGERTEAALDQDPTRGIGQDVSDVSRAVDAVDIATVRSWLGLGPGPTEGCTDLLRTRAEDHILPNVPEALVWECVRALVIARGEAPMSPDLQQSLLRTIDTGGALPAVLLGNARAITYQWDLLRRLGYPRAVVDATWKGLVDPQQKTGTGAEAEFFLRDLIKESPITEPTRVDTLLHGGADSDQKILLISAYVRKRSSCRPSWTNWLAAQISTRPRDTNYGLIGYASAVASLEKCSSADAGLISAARARIDDASRDTGPADGKSAINDEWLAIEARCLAKLPTPRERLLRDLKSALQQDFTDARLGSRLYYAILRIAEIVDRGCTSAWWS